MDDEDLKASSNLIIVVIFVQPVMTGLGEQCLPLNDYPG